MVATLLGPGAVIGQIIGFDVTYDFGNVQNGDELLLQPSGDPLFEAACFQLVGSGIVYSEVNAIPADPGMAAVLPTNPATELLTAAGNQLYFLAGANQGGSGHDVIVRYYFEYRCLGVSSTALPYAAQTSGANNRKYTGNYNDDPPPGDTILPGVDPFTIAKTANPTSLPPTGGTVTYTVVITNTDPSGFGLDAYVDSISDTLPTVPATVTYVGLSGGSAAGTPGFVSSSNSSVEPSASDTGTIQWNAKVTGSVRNWVVPAGGTLTLVYQVNVPGTVGAYTNSVVTNTGATDTSTVTVAQQADVGVTKTDSSATYTPGGSVTYTVVVTNAGPGAANGTIITDDLPEPPLSNITWNCVQAGGAVCPNASGTGDISETIATLPVGGSLTYTVTADIDVTATGNLVNTASVAPPAGTTDPDSSNDSATDTDTLNAQLGLAVIKTANPSSVTAPGGDVTFTVRVDNVSNVVVTLNSLVDDVHGDLNGQGTCGVPVAVAVGGFYECQFTVTVTGDPGFVETDTITVTGTDGGGQDVAGSDSAEVAVIGPEVLYFDPAVSKIGTLEPGELGLPGESLTWVVTITNVGNAPGYNIVITDTIQPELQITGATIDFGTVSISGQTVTFNIPVLNPGDVVTAQVDTLVLESPASGMFDNTVTVTGTGPDGTVSTDSTSASLSVPTSLPDTGYPPASEKEAVSSTYTVIIGAICIMLITLTGWFLHRRKRGGSLI